MSEQKQIFVLSGQSNMAGRGGVRHHRWDGVVPTECRPNPSILRFSARCHWEEAHDPLHRDIDTAKICGVGPGMAFANALLPCLSDEAVLGLVPCAIGGTAIKEWERGSRLYEEMVRRARKAAELGGGGEIKAVLWYQGESDTTSHGAAEAYAANIEKLIRDVRLDLSLPSLPFIQVAIASGDKHYIEKIREAQLGISMPDVLNVDAMGLPLNEDNLHLTTEAQVLLGNMLAEAYAEHYLTTIDGL
uniref:Sialate O-acetylesterase domain-containing protein n=1 Tax=Musa acuminata subsp. malaccensis TaxID=214687 RepID=A0A804KEK6_MUSAM|nr:PREDICTED: probable carbohydrate esterase At4g34215 [Musa acuminata subsp. malaccensis]